VPLIDHIVFSCPGNNSTPYVHIKSEHSWYENTIVDEVGFEMEYFTQDIILFF